MWNSHRRNFRLKKGIYKQLDEVDTGHFRDKGKGARSPQVRLDDIHLIVFGKKLAIAWPRNSQSFGNSSTSRLYLPHRFSIDRLWRQHNRCIARMDARVF